MDKRLIYELFGHFLTRGNLGIWAEIGVPVHCGRGFCREGWETLREREEIGKHPERNLPLVIKVLVKLRHESAAHRVLLQFHGVKHHSGNRKTQLKHSMRHRGTEQENSMIMIWRHRITLTAVQLFHSDSCTAYFILGKTYGNLTQRKKMHLNA
jgi:hypothetical protein